MIFRAHPAATNDFMPGRKRDQVGKPGAVQAVTILHILRDGFGEGHQFWHRLFFLLTRVFFLISLQDFIQGPETG